ncbi:MAG TPA: DUF4129 domain-containing protein [Chloroflexia bacterium]|nr:DUF4129 domain-containing protein [Chloroflexia bacterium]
MDAVPAGQDAGQAAAITRALVAIPESVTVADAQGPLAAIDLRPLRDSLQKQPPDLVGAHQYLTALLDLLDPGSLPPATPTPDETPPPGPGTSAPIRTPAYLPAPETGTGPPLSSGDAGARLDRVLADPRFRQAAGNGIQQGLSQALQPFVTFLLQMPPRQRNVLIALVAGLLVAFMVYSGYREAPWRRERYWATILGAGGGTAGLVYVLLTYFFDLVSLIGPAVGLGLGGLGVIVALGVLVYLVFGLRRARAPIDARLTAAFAAEAGWTAAQARLAALTAASALDYRKAVRYRYLATLLALDEAGHMRFDPALTNGEYLRQAPAGMREPLRPLIQRFERFWYGGYPATAQDYAAYQALATTAEQVGPEARS